MQPRRHSAFDCNKSVVVLCVGWYPLSVRARSVAAWSSQRLAKIARRRASRLMPTRNRSAPCRCPKRHKQVIWRLAQALESAGYQHSVTSRREVGSAAARVDLADTEYGVQSRTLPPHQNGKRRLKVSNRFRRRGWVCKSCGLRDACELGNGLGRTANIGRLKSGNAAPAQSRRL